MEYRLLIEPLGIEMLQRKGLILLWGLLIEPLGIEIRSI